MANMEQGYPMRCGDSLRVAAMRMVAGATHEQAAGQGGSMDTFVNSRAYQVMAALAPSQQQLPDAAQLVKRLHLVSQ